MMNVLIVSVFMSFMLLVMFFAEWFYPVVCEVYWRGQTPGKKLFGLKVVRDDGAAVAGSDPGLVHKPIMRVEGACASGGLAMACGVDALKAGADVALIAGVEVQTTASARIGGDYLATVAGRDKLMLEGIPVGLIVAIANYTLTAGQLVFEGIVLGTVATLVIYHLMDALERLRGPRADARDDHAPPATAPADEAR